MAHLSPLGPVYQGGTLSGNPLAMAAGLATLNLCTDDAYGALEERTVRFVSALTKAIAESEMPIQVPRVGTITGLHLSTREITNYDEAKAANANGLYAPFFHEMLKRGVAMAPGPYEALFPSFAHTDADLDAVVNAAGESAAAVMARGTAG